MLDIKFIRENPEKVKKGARDKGIKVDVDRILELDKKNREVILTAQKLLEERNKLAHDPEVIKRALEQKSTKITPEVIKRALEIKEKVREQEGKQADLKKELNNLLLALPNIPKPDVRVGKDESENEIIRKHGEPTKFDFTAKDHLDIGVALDIIDTDRASKVSGARFAYLKNEGVLLEFALVQFALETLTKEGFTPVVPPVLIKQEITQGLGYWQNRGNEDYYLIIDYQESESGKERQNPLYLVGTAEHSIVPMHMDEIFAVKDLPRRYVGFSTAFRREAGSYGKDTRGILRVHQFDKVEMVSYVADGQDDKEQEYLLSLEERLFQALAIPYQVVKMCTGDLGFPAARKYDIEAWMPGQNKYREVTSVSTVTDFQSRRLNIRYQDGNEKKFVSILNGTGFAIGRTIIAIIENCQEEDGSVKIPEVLQKYMGESVIKPLKMR